MSHVFGPYLRVISLLRGKGTLPGTIGHLIGKHPGRWGQTVMRKMRLEGLFRC